MSPLNSPIMILKQLLLCFRDLLIAAKYSLVTVLS